MIDSVSIEKCVICGNCVNICPKKAISLKNKKRGFSYPQINRDICVECNLCEKVCPAINPLKKGTILSSFELKHNADSVLLNSSSGGVFFAIANWILEQNGIVVGAQFSNSFYVEHTLISRVDELKKIQGSKYVQSRLSDVFLSIQQSLEDGIKVLFTGTPCQAAALRVFLRKEYENLFVVDFICHGILSEELFMEYLEYLENKEKSEIVSFTFRGKKYGWIESGPNIVFKNGITRHWPLYEDIYMQGYFQGICMRESCYSCAYKDLRSGSDITIGDFWGAEILDAEFYNPNGVSMCSVQTTKGEALLNSVKGVLYKKPQPIEVLTKYNQGFFVPFKKGEKYDVFQRTEPSFESLRKITAPTVTERFKRKLRKFRRFLRK